MDPVTLTAGISGLLVTVGRIIGSANNLLNKYDLAGVIVASLVAECAALQTYLDQIKDLFLRPNGIFKDRNEVLVAMNDTLAACSLLLKVLNEDLEKLHSPKSVISKVRSKTKLQLIWNESRVAQLQNALRGQREVLGSLVNCLHSKSIEEILVFVREQAPSFQRVVANSQQLVSVPREHDVASIDTGSIFSFSSRRQRNIAVRKGLNQRNRTEPREVEELPRQDRSPRQENEEIFITGLDIEVISDTTYPNRTQPSRWITHTDPNPAGSGDRTESEELFEAITSRNYGLLNILVDVGVDLSLRDAHGQTPLLATIHRGDFQAFRILASKGVGLEAACRAAQCHSARPIHCAAMSDSVEILCFFLDRGISVNSIADGKRTALHFAAIHDSPNVARLLLQRKVRQSAQDTNGDLAIHTGVKAMARGFLESVLTSTAIPEDSMLEATNAAGKRALQLALETGWMDGFRLLRDHGANIHAADGIGANLMHNLARCSVPGAFQELVNEGLGVDARDSFGMVPLHHAVLSSFNSTQVIRLLHDSGADLEARCVRDPFDRIDFNEQGRQIVEHFSRDGRFGEADIENATILGGGSSTEGSPRRGSNPPTGPAREDATPAGHHQEPPARGTPRRGSLAKDGVSQGPSIQEKSLSLLDKAEPQKLIGPTPLLLAARYAPATLVTCLLDSGASTLAVDSCGCVALQRAKSNPDIGVFIAILNHEIGFVRASGTHSSGAEQLALIVASKRDFFMVRARVCGYTPTQTQQPPEYEEIRSAGPDCNCSKFSLPHFIAALERCKEEGTSVAMPNPYLKQTLLEYLVKQNHSVAVRCLLEHDIMSELAADTELKYQVLRKDECQDNRAKMISTLRNAYGGRIRQKEREKLDAYSRRRARRRACSSAARWTLIFVTVLVLLTSFAGLTYCWTMYNRAQALHRDCSTGHRSPSEHACSHFDGSLTSLYWKMGLVCSVIFAAVCTLSVAIISVKREIWIPVLLSFSLATWFASFAGLIYSWHQYGTQNDPHLVSLYWKCGTACSVVFAVGFAFLFIVLLCWCDDSEDRWAWTSLLVGCITLASFVGLIYSWHHYGNQHNPHLVSLYWKWGTACSVVFAVGFAFLFIVLLCLCDDDEVREFWTWLLIGCITLASLAGLIYCWNSYRGHHNLDLMGLYRRVGIACTVVFAFGSLIIVSGIVSAWD